VSITGETTSSCQMRAMSGKLRDSPITMRARPAIEGRLSTPAAPARRRGARSANGPSKASVAPRTASMLGTIAARTTARNRSSLVAK
jgi:hypothetical protein